jgi:hypothetical protein
MATNGDGTVHPPTVLETMRREVTDPTTSPERLSQIFADISEIQADFVNIASRQGSRELIPQIVAHPNVPLRLLVEGGVMNGMSLLAQFPEAFLKNPVAPLLPLEQPDFAERAGQMAILRLLALADIPPAYVAMARGHSDSLVCSAADCHIHTLGELDPDAPVWEAKTREWLLGVPLHDINAVWGRIEIGEAPAWLPEPLRDRHGLPWWREEPVPDKPEARARAVALNPATPDDTLEALARSSEWGVRAAVYANPASSDFLRDRIRDQGSTYLHYRPPDIWYFLMVARLPQNRAGELSGTHYPSSPADRIARANPLHRLALAVNPSLPAEQRSQLAADGHALVRAAAQAYLRRGTALWE